MLANRWRKGNSGAPLVGMQAGAASVEGRTELPQKLKIELPYDPAIPLLGIYTKEPIHEFKIIHAPLCALQHY